MSPANLEVGDIVQLSPDARNKAFAYCLMVVSEPKAFGAQGYVQGVAGGQYYYRATWEEMEPTGGAAPWIAA